MSELTAIDNSIISIGGSFVQVVPSTPVDPYNPLGLPPYTLRLLYRNVITPTFEKGTAVQVSSTPNVWDLTYENTAWIEILRNHTNLLEVLGANSTGVTNLYGAFNGCDRLERVALFDTSLVVGCEYLFSNCSNLEEVPLFDLSSCVTLKGTFEGCTSIKTIPQFNTSNVGNMMSAFEGCTYLRTVPLLDLSNNTTLSYTFNNCRMLQEIPLFDTSKVDSMGYAFCECRSVKRGALAIYQQASTQQNPPVEYGYAFFNCGINTKTGSAELARIPKSWK